MKFLLLAAVTYFALGVPTCRVDNFASDSEPISHELWDAQLDRFVSDAGWVDYDAWKKDTVGLQEYLTLLEANHPNETNWSRDERLAYWINAYNAYTVELMLMHWPLESIKDIKDGIGFVNSVWDIKFIEIEGQEYDLNNLEHGIIRPKFEDPRIHAAVNCASVSCPVLRNEAFTAKDLDAQLDDQVKRWFNSNRNDLSNPSQPKLSSIMKWYGDDFQWNDGSLETFVEKYSGVQIPDGTKFQYLDYDWGVNSQQANQG